MTSRESFSQIEASRILGVSRWTIYRLVREGKIAAFHVGGCTRIHLGELKRYKRDQMIAAGEGAERSTT